MMGRGGIVIRAHRSIAAGAAAVLLAATLGGCTSQYVDDNGPPELEPVKRVTQTGPAAAAEPRSWSCSDSPTFDRDWHNDVICYNGVESHRPYLRGDDSYVTESEIMASAREYEAELNSQAAVAAGTWSRIAGAEPTHTKVGTAKSYRSVKALVSAVKAAGYICPSWETDDGTALSLESGSCSEMDRFSIYASEKDVQGMVERLAADSWSRGKITWLVGPNWIITAEEADLVRMSRTLKGTLVRF